MLVLYENPAEMEAAIRLMRVLDKAGYTLANAEIVDAEAAGGPVLRINPGPMWNIVARVASYANWAEHFERVKTIGYKAVRPRPPKAVRDLIFDEDI